MASRYLASRAGFDAGAKAGLIVGLIVAALQAAILLSLGPSRDQGEIFVGLVAGFPLGLLFEELGVAIHLPWILIPIMIVNVALLGALVGLLLSRLPRAETTPPAT